MAGRFLASKVVAATLWKTSISSRIGCVLQAAFLAGFLVMDCHSKARW